jgi:hypothetical protein
MEGMLLKAKFEARNPKLETNSNDQNPNLGIFSFEHSSFEIVSDFDIRISDI